VIFDTADIRFARFLEDKYKEVAELNKAYGTTFASFASVTPAFPEEDYADVMTLHREIRRDYLTRNYIVVIKQVFLQGRAIFNTFLLVLLTVATQITVNPLAAYALSRYRLRYTAQVLIFMLATMAFPAEVAMIPNFLLIRDLGLLNTFAALILPGLASGYSVFLLKGFFDSLPAELYEAGSIDGANEFRMFWTITMPLSLPILSVIALFSFAGAYGSFLWAVTTCQNPKMWTLMVFLQQFQISGNSCPYLVMASLVVAAIPTVIVFLSAQKVLMKGIVVPTMK
jgi:ABC-type glycerol-3-phosphate transport system permease component